MGHLVMPIEENLTVQLPPNEKFRFMMPRVKQTFGLVITSGKLEDYNNHNINFEDL